MENVSHVTLVDEMNRNFKSYALPVIVFVGSEIILGFFGNVLVIYVFSMHYRVCTFKYFALCLAIIDVTCCVTTMPGEIVTQLYWYKYPVKEYCKFKSFFNVFTVIAEALCLLTIAFDRYRKVCRPFGWQIKPHIAKYLCGVFYIVAAFLALPTAFLWGLRSPTRTYKNVTLTITICEKDETYEKTELPIAFISSVGSLVLVLLILMFVQYVFVYRKLFKEKHYRMGSNQPMVNNRSSFSRQENNATGSTCNDERSNNKDLSVDNAHALKTATDHETEVSSKVSKSTSVDSEKPKDDKDSAGQDKETTNSKHSRGENPAFSRKIPQRVKRKTLIMFILTVTFIVTITTYFVMLILIASPTDIIRDMTDGETVTYFLFFRFYFINHVMNPFVFGILDPQFKNSMKKIIRSFIGKIMYSKK